MKKITKTTIAIIIIVIFVGGLFVVLYPSNIGADTMSTNNGDVDVHLMGVSIQNPYGAGRVTVLSDNYGNGYVDTTRTNWLYDSGTTIWDTYPEMSITAARPGLVDSINPNIDSVFGWVSGPTTDFTKWNNDNYWRASSGCTIDPDGFNSGVPDLTVSISNLYPSDSNGNPDEDYKWSRELRTLVDSEGNTREVEINSGFLTLEVQYSVVADYYAVTAGINGDQLFGFAGECVGYYPSIYNMWSSLGADLGFESTFRFQISSLEFDDGWYLNPSWINLGNGILSVYKRGFGYATDIEGQQYTIVTPNTLGWDNKGSNNIETTQAMLLQKYSNLLSAVDKSDSLPTDIGGNIIDFKENNPDVVYFNVANNVRLGMDSGSNIFGNSWIADLRVQSISWVQRITVKFYTSVAKPLGGAGNDPITIVITNPDPPPRERLWDKLIIWVMELTGLDFEQAEALVIAIIVLLGIIISGVVLAIVAPGIYPLIGKAIAGMFRRMRRTRG